VKGSRFELGAARVESIDWRPETTQVELTLSMAEIDGQFSGLFTGNADLFERRTLKCMARHWTTLLDGILAEPDRRVSRLPLLAPSEHQQIVKRWNATAASVPADTLPALIAAQAARDPTAVAVCGADGELTYGELDAQANRIARWVRAQALGDEAVVGVSISRGPALVAAVLGILKSGAAYLPLDPSYPADRLRLMIADSRTRALVTERGGAPTLRAAVPHVYEIGTANDGPAGEESDENGPIDPDRTAYVIYTSGSTGRPKGVAITHRNLMQLCRALDEVVSCTAADTVTALTSLSFDISVVELLYPLTRGARVLLIADDQLLGPMRPKPRTVSRPMRFSLFYFSSDATHAGDDKYRLLREGALFADRHGFDAIWTPERHFHAFGGLFPNPSVLGAALAALTTRLEIRAGSVVVPLHEPLRVAEEWAVVDNLSNGRVGIACASGWHPNDFALRPQAYADRRGALSRGIDTLRRLWRGESITVPNGEGRDVDVTVWPRPIQPELPIWVTTGGSRETWIKAGEIGAHVLTHFLGQTIEDLESKIGVYRRTLAEHGHDPARHRVTLMLHTYLDRDGDRARETVHEPFVRYLDSSVDLIASLARNLERAFDPDTMSASDRRDLLIYAFNRYARSHALFGSPEECAPLIDRLRALGVDEIACLIDFGVETASVVESLPVLDELKQLSNAQVAGEPRRLADTLRRYAPTVMQCTPTLARLLAEDEEIAPVLRGLRLWLVGGEALPGALAMKLRQQCDGRIVNMYGPTETTVWSLAHEVAKPPASGTVSIGRPLPNTHVYVVDEEGQPVPVGVPGEIQIGGAGVGRGYWWQPATTAVSFRPDPFGPPGARVYVTGDIARYRADGTLEFLGRRDQQVKLRGFRIELTEIEAALRAHSAVQDAAVVVHPDDDARLVAYVVAASMQDGRRDPADVRDYLTARLPGYMVPADIVFVAALPTTPNGKIDRRALPSPASLRAPAAATVAPATRLEQQIAEIWQHVLHRPAVGIHDNFFDLGGHSLAMAQVHSELQRAIGQHVPLMRLFEHPTISGLAAHLGRTVAPSDSRPAVAERAHKQRAALLRAAAQRRPLATLTNG
jgi:natural product biosynthesis luciferase-like monooxygenase protein